MNDNQQRPALGKYSFRSWVESEFVDEPEVSPPPRFYVLSQIKNWLFGDNEDSHKILNYISVRLEKDI